MTFIEFFKQQFIEEGNTTRKMLSRIQEHQLAYQPHPKSMDMKRLALHIADLPGWIHLIFTTDVLDFAQPYHQPEIHSTDDLMAYFEKRYEDGLSTLVPENEALLNKPWTLRNAETIYSVEPKIDVIRMSLSQQIHHRAQLGVYLRLLDTPIPGSYGPSADEAVFQKAEAAV
ncbi:DinB family protein [Chitinophagaceae bacterium LB-8]|uniref:DinB family protein n=1 Tax=Paraflavisolibacter caeni TaxID=2982496 RepID=A0A9X2Y0B4_9BACT|nr:DinB family protein [Paraflavisolibacter caeni]MCU7552017.1 DinB family protein [Paraflavisolibacter caeni]